MVLLAIECLYEVKMYDFSVFNPINFQVITMCEFALQYYPESVSIYSWLIKFYSKLGLPSLVTELSERFPCLDNLNRERLGASCFSVYTDFGMESSLEKLIQQYKDFYKDEVNANKDAIVMSFSQCDFDSIRPMMKKNEKLQQSGFQHGIGLAETIIQVHKNETEPNKMH